MNGRNRSTILNRELSNLDKDLKTRKSAMKALKSYVETMDSTSIPLFLSRVSETKETGSLSGEYTISLFEVLARVHGVKAAPHIDTIMKIVNKTLSLSAGSSPLQQACSKVVLAFARYCIDPGTCDKEKKRIVDSILSPLVESLVSNQECLSSGSALCLKALVELDNWRFASHSMVNKVCQNVAVVLEEIEKSIKSNSHMSLVMSLSKRAPSFVEAYARLFLKAGVAILNAGRVVQYRDSQKRLLAIQMVDFMMKCLDRETISPSMLDSIVKEMESCLSDKMAWVREHAFEALKTAKKISEEAASEFDKSSGSVRGRSRSRTRRRNPSSQESQTFDSCIMEYDSMVESPLSGPPANRAMLSSDNARVDVSLSDGLFSELANDHGSPFYNPLTESIARDYAAGGEFTGFTPRSNRNGMPRSRTPSPQKSRSNVNGDKFATPKTLISSAQHTGGTVDSEFCENRSRRSLRTPCSCNNYSNCQTSKIDEHGSDDNGVEYNANENGDVAESVSSTDDILPPATDAEEVVAEKQPRKSSSRWLFVTFIFAIFSVFASLLFLFLFFDGSEQEGHYLRPT